MTVHKLIEEIAKKFEGVPGVVGVVLGGSRARGTHRETSDIDIGIYYDESAGFNVNEVSEIATQIDDEHRENLITPLGGWGPWVNGGGWLAVQGYHVDIIFRDIMRVSQVIEDCLLGSITTNYQAGHPHGYLSVMYMGEISVCKILYDPANKLAELKEKTVPYPKVLQEAIIGYFMFEASFSLMAAEANVDKDDISYVAGCCFRTISCLNQVLFAKNEEYCINEKKAVAMIDAFHIKPKNYKEKIDQIITFLSFNKENTEKGVNMLRDLVSEIQTLLS